MGRFWRWAALFAWRRWSRAEGRRPVGVPGNRDPESPCPAYAPRRPRFGDFKDCEGDGHYLCKECAHRATEVRHG